MANSQNSIGPEELFDLVTIEIPTIFKLSKPEIEGLVSLKSDRLSFETKEKQNSDVWKTFELVLVDKQLQNFVRCIRCKSILSYSPATGTSTLKRHVNSCGAASIKAKTMDHIKKDDSQPKILQFTNRNVPKEAIEDLNDTLVIGLAQDLRPLGAIDAKGFKKIAQALINFGALYGQQNVSKVLRHSTTLKRNNLPKIISSKEEEMIQTFDAAPQCPIFAFTTDMWADKYKQRQFLSLTIHFIDSNWKLVRHMLAVDEFLAPRKTTENIRIECVRILEKFFQKTLVPSIIEKSWLVTDGGSNMVKLFPNREACFCHKINLLVQWTLNSSTPPSEAEIHRKEEQGKTIPPKKLFTLKDNCPVLYVSLYLQS